MYSTCLFCHRGLGTNEVIEPFPVGRRLAFDAKRGRLWVICSECRRWNLTPLEERWEALEECERRFRETRLRVSTDHIGLARLREGLELVRIGEPLRPEFAAWRYGEALRARRTRIMKVGAVGLAAAAVAPVAVVGVAMAVGAQVAAGALMFGAATATPYFLAARGFTPPWRAMYPDPHRELGGDRVVARIPTKARHIITVRDKHLSEAELEPRGDGAIPALRVPHDRGDHEFEESAALRACGLLLARSNWRGATTREVDSAVERIASAGDAVHLLSRTAMRAHRLRHRRLMAGWRDIHAINLSFVERLAMEMAVHEEAERRALEGELEILEAAWRDAEEIAAIADDLLPPTIEDVRRSLGIHGIGNSSRQPDA